MYSSTGLRHLHKRKRVHVKHKPYPHPNRAKRVVNSFAMLIGVVGPTVTIPQIMKIFTEQNAAGVSITAWVGYALIAMFWLSYSLLHHEKPLMFTYSLTFILNSTVIVGILLYG